MNYLGDTAAEVYYFFRLGKPDKEQSRVLYYSSATDQSQEYEINDLPPQEEGTKRLVVVSDTHNAYSGLNLPRGDIFIHGGDILMTTRMLSTASGVAKLREFNEWLGTLDFKEKIIIAGNHDQPLQELGTEKARQLLSNAIYLENDYIEVESLKIFGSPLSSGHSHNDAFQSEEFYQETKRVVSNMSGQMIDVLITHGPNFNVAENLQPQLHIWGHLHNGYGIHRPGKKVRGKTLGALSVNACIMTTKYNPDNIPIVVDYQFSSRI